MSVQEYDILNLDCAGCSAKIEAEIQALPEVSSANLDFINKKLIVQYHSLVDNPLQRLNQIAGSIEPGVTFAPAGAGTEARPQLGRWLWLGLGAVLVVSTLLIAAPMQIWIGIAGYLLVAHRVLTGAAKSLFSRQIFSEQLLMSLATLGAMVLGEYLEAGAVMLLYELGLELEHRAVEHSRRSVRRLLLVRPETAHLQTSEGIQAVKLAQIKPGDTILVYPGERVPLDGMISKGSSTVDTSTLTGEAEPLYVDPGTEIFAGFINHGGLLEIQVQSTEAESAVARILKLIDSAGSRKSAQEKFITRFARVYTPVVVLLALLVFVMPTLLGQPAALWFKRSLVFLIVSCPCALVISIPLTYYIGIGLAARGGIIFKGSVWLDALRRVRTLVFDKTGTLTTGDLRVQKLLQPAGADPAELLQTLYLCEYTSSHPFARAIKAAYQGSYDSSLVNAYSEYPGRGVLLEYGGDRLIVGSEAFLGEYGFVGLIRPDGQSAVHAVMNDFYLGCATFGDELKTGIAEALTELRQLGIANAVMLSGDRAAKAELVCAELKLDQCFAELLPEQKLAQLEALMRESDGLLAYVGDGMNDAPALARADAGIAMGAIGNQSAIETADIVLLNDKPQQLVAAFRVSRQTGRVVVQNIVTALGVKILVMALGLGGVSGLWEAVIADVGVTLLVVFNSLRLLKPARSA